MGYVAARCGRAQCIQPSRLFMRTPAEDVEALLGHRRRRAGSPHPLALPALRSIGSGVSRSIGAGRPACSAWRTATRISTAPSSAPIPKAVRHMRPLVLADTAALAMEHARSPGPKAIHAGGSTMQSQQGHGQPGPGPGAPERIGERQQAGQDQGGRREMADHRGNAEALRKCQHQREQQTAHADQRDARQHAMRVGRNDPLVSQHVHQRCRPPGGAT